MRTVSEIAKCKENLSVYHMIDEHSNCWLHELFNRINLIKGQFDAGLP